MKNHNRKKIELSNKHIDEDESVSTKRRRFVRYSAVAVPTVLTLRSGAGVAQAMASINCAMKNQANAALLDPKKDLFIPSTIGDDGFLRTEVIVRELREIIKPKKKWEFKLDGSNKWIEIQIYQSAAVDMGNVSNMWWTKSDIPEQVQDIDKTVKVEGVSYQQFTLDTRNFASVQELPSCYGLLGVNMDGEIVPDDTGHLSVGIYPSGAMTNITTSCMASVNPDAMMDFGLGG